MVGGGTRQAGILAAGGIYALENNIERLQDDHNNAKILAAGLHKHDALTIDSVATNMVFLQMNAKTADALADYLQENRILISPGEITRLVTHLDINIDDVDLVLSKIAGFFKQSLT